MNPLILRIFRALGVALFAVVVGFMVYKFATDDDLAWRSWRDLLFAIPCLIVVAFALRLAWEGFRPRPDLLVLDERPGWSNWIASILFGIVQAGIMAWAFALRPDGIPASSVMIVGGAIAFFVTFMITRTIDGLAWIYSAIRGSVVGVARRGRVIDRASAAATGSRRGGPRAELVR